jgi:hypothetical protein
MIQYLNLRFAAELAKKIAANGWLATPTLPIPPDR